MVLAGNGCLAAENLLLLKDTSSFISGGRDKVKDFHENN